MREAEVVPIEILSAVPGTLQGNPIILLSVRADPCNSFDVIDVAAMRIIWKSSLVNLPRSSCLICPENPDAS